MRVGRYLLPIKIDPRSIDTHVIKMFFLVKLRRVSVFHWSGLNYVFCGGK